MCQLTNHALIFTGLLFIGGGICGLLSVTFREKPDEKALTMEDYEYTVKVDEKNRMLNDETFTEKFEEKNRKLNNETSMINVNDTIQEEHKRKISTYSLISSCRSQLE